MTRDHPPERRACHRAGPIATGTTRERPLRRLLRLACETGAGNVKGMRAMHKATGTDEGHRHDGAPVSVLLTAAAQHTRAAELCAGRGVAATLLDHIDVALACLLHARRHLTAAPGKERSTLVLPTS